MNRGFLIGMVLVLAAIACNAPISAGEVEQPLPTEDPQVAPQSEDPSPPVTEAPPTAEAAPPAGPTAVCPEPTEGTFLFTSEAAGYCLLIPAELERIEQSFYSAPDAYFQGDVLFPDSMESPSFFIRVNVLGAPGAADDVTPADFIGQGEQPFGPVQERGAVTIDGREALLVTLPGMFATRAAIVQANDTLYQLSTIEPGEIEQEFAERINAQWDTALTSLTFFPPTEETDLLGPDEVCLEPGEGQQQELDLQDGFCFLLPEDATEDAEFMNRFLIGPDIGEIWPGGAERMSITVDNQGDPNNGDTLQEILETRQGAATNPDQVSYEFITIGDQEGAVVYDLSGPVPSRVGYVWLNNDLYTLVAQPDDPQAYPEAHPALEELWASITDTIRFFEPWR